MASSVERPASHEARPHRHARRRTVLSGRVVALGVAALALVAVGLATGYVLGAAGSSDTAGGADSSAPHAAPAPAPSPVTAASGLPSRPAMIGEVTRVVSGDEVVVRSADSDMRVRILGLATPEPMSASPGGSSTAECGSREALEFADGRLTGQAVTLVPDPTQPELDDRGRRLAYVVLRSQLNYTDDALLAGIGRADTSMPLWYADVFAREQRTAVDGGRGIWGPPCRTTP
jgi:endonuclease YncB( thermonuclease family)